MMRSEHGRGILLALVAGTMAALASTSAKLAMTAEAVQHICSDIVKSACQKIIFLFLNQNICCGYSLRQFF